MVPDTDGMIDAYKSGEYPFDRFREVTYGSQEYDGDFHFNAFTVDSLSAALTAAGFVDIQRSQAIGRTGAARSSRSVLADPQTDEPVVDSRHPAVSVIVCTDGRAGPLKTCLDSLRYLRYPNFEVVVVAGPTRDGTHELCEGYGDAIKFGTCPERNLSMSRNIGVRLADGEILAFLDDDAIPEPEWLDDLVPAFDDPEVAVAGGFLLDHTGKEYQCTYATVDRYGSADQTWSPSAGVQLSTQLQCPSCDRGQ